MKGASTLPGWPLMLRRDLAAAYVGLSPSTFDAELEKGNLPAPLPMTDTIKAWHRGDLELWAEARRAAAAEVAGANPWDAP